MKANKLITLIALLLGPMGVTAAWAHPGHEHGQGIAESLLHAAQTEWLAPFVALLLLAVAAYFYVRKADKE